MQIKVEFIVIILCCFVVGLMAKRRRELINFPDKKIRPKQNSCVQSICNSTLSKYPAKLISKKLEKDQSFSEFGGLVITPYEVERIQTRLSPDLKNMCNVRRFVMYPKAIRNIDLEFKFIVQDKKLRQGVVFETCEEHSKCFADDYLPNDYETFCKQQHVVIKLLTLDANNNLRTDLFPIPGGCVCTYAGFLPGKK